MAETDDDETVREFKALLRAEGYAVTDASGNIIDVNAAGRAWLRSIGFNWPDDKTMLVLGLEALAEEVCVEEMEKAAGRPMVRDA